jgi:serine/threonine-protein kinase
LHASGVLHGDVHERNILVDAFGNVCILDFGLARTIDDAGQPPPRGGIGTYFEPEYAQARYEGHRVPPVTESGEQYSIAALLYYLYAGAHYIEFALETRDALRQTASAVPLSFAERSVRPFPALERVLATAMSKHPAQRYATTAEFAQRLRDVLTSMDVVASDGASFGGSAERRAVIDAALNALAPQAALFEHGALDAPTCSVNFGAAGIACALYRMALARDDAVLLSQADAWCNRAKAWLTSDSAFDAPALDITREGIGSISLYHSVTGVYVIAALIANAMGDYASLQYNLDAFVSAAAQPCDNPDLTLGRSGTLLSCALLLEAIPRTPLVKTAAVRRLGATTYRGIWAQIMTHPDVREPAPFLNLGIAHGWAGVLYASLRWAGVSRRRPPLRVRDRLDQLARCAEPFGRGLRWSWREPRAVVSSRGYMSGWCNGSAGFVYLWLLAHDMLGGTAYERLATGAAWSAWDGADENSPDLCCGVGGRAYALLAMHRHTGDEIWLQRASMLGETAAALSAGVGPRELTSLYKGPLGSALLAVELERPERARMPLFEREGWPAP